jgi:hypothetical protein
MTDHSKPYRDVSRYPAAHPRRNDENPPKSTAMVTTCTAGPSTADEDHDHATACHLYDAECALHVAHQTHVDAWITAASDRLHQAVATHLAAVVEHDAGCPQRCPTQRPHGTGKTPPTIRPRRSNS